jgi:hypothetical protein
LKWHFTWTVTAFYERGCQEKYFGDDWMTIDYPAHTSMWRCGFRFSANACDVGSTAIDFRTQQAERL